MFEYSRKLAWIFGVALPIVETARRWHQLGDPSIWPTWLDDFLLAALLLTGARLTSQLRYHNAKYLAAAWGVTCGMAYGSFFNTVLHLDVADPGPLPTPAVAWIKGIGLALAIAALVGALKHPPVYASEQVTKKPELLDEMLDATDDA